jgi:sulfur-oxidizing protein SoxY
MELTRRELLRSVCAGTAALGGAVLPPISSFSGDDALAFVAKTFGRGATMSSRVQLTMPSVFPTGYTVPMDIAIDTAMTDDDHVRSVRVFAPGNPLLEVAGFNFVVGRSVPRVSTRIRLAKPQFVVAIAEMNDGALLANKVWVDVATDGCA